MTDLLIGMVAGAFLILTGCFAGAWLTYRKQMKASPMPTIFKMPGTDLPSPDDGHYEKVPDEKRIGV